MHTQSIEDLTMIWIILVSCVLVVNSFEISENEWMAMQSLVASQQATIAEMKQRSSEFENKVLSEITSMKEKIKRQDNIIQFLKAKNKLLENNMEQYRLKGDFKENTVQFSNCSKSTTETTKVQHHGNNEAQFSGPGIHHSHDTDIVRKGKRLHVYIFNISVFLPTSNTTDR